MLNRLKRLLTSSSELQPTREPAPKVLAPAEPEIDIDIGLIDIHQSGWLQNDTGELVRGFAIGPEDSVLDIGCGEGGYARELTAQEKDKIASVVTRHIQQADIVITTAAIPGRPSPKLISKAQVDGMKLGAVIIDLAAEGGGNCEYSIPGETVTQGQVTIVAPLNVPSMLAEHASELYAKNLLNLLQLLIIDGAITLNWDDEVLAKTVLTHNGEIKPEAVKAALAKH